MEFLDDAITTNDIHDIFRLATVLGSMEILELRESIKDDNDKVLLQSKRPLKTNLLEALDDKYKGKKFNFVIELTESIRLALLGLLRKDIEKKLGMFDYSFAGYLFKKSKLDMARVVKRALSKNYFVTYLISLLYGQRKIWEHLMEVALTSVGLLASVGDDDVDYSDYGVMFQAGMMHDFSISQMANWEELDSFEGTVAEHDKESGAKIAGKDLHPAIKEIIENHSHLRVRFLDENDAKITRWYQSKTDIMSTILHVVEYFIWFNKEMPAGGEGDGVSGSVLYQMGLLTEKGNFPYGLMRFFKLFYSKYAEVFEYGQEIGKIENACVHKLYALAYPKPKATQILCRDNLRECPNRIHSQRINIVTSVDEENNRFGSELKKGWYDKCSLSSTLPHPPESL